MEERLAHQSYNKQDLTPLLSDLTLITLIMLSNGDRAPAP